MFTISQHHEFIRPAQLAGDERIVLSIGRDILLTPSRQLPQAAAILQLLPPDTPLLVTGALDGRPVCAAELPPDAPVQSTATLIRSGARTVFLADDPALVNAVCRSRTLAAWAALHRFCGRCAQPLQPAPGDLALACPHCRARYYPQVAPAVIVAVSRNNGQELLLAHNRSFEDNIYGLLAGFIEAGETAEQAVSREIMEEAGISVRNIRYLRSQPWPFPNSLMVAFTAEYAAGDAHPDGTELTRLGWFNRGSLPQLPRAGSIAARVIADFFKL